MRHRGRVTWLREYESPGWTLAGFYIKARIWTECLPHESGQDLIEYAIVAALISLAAVASMNGVATLISTAFTNIGTKFSTYTS